MALTKKNKISKTNKTNKSNKSNNSNKTERIDLEKIRDNCLKKNCKKLEKRKELLDKKLNKLKKQKCSKYDNEKYTMSDYMKCSRKVEDDSGYTKAFNNEVKCNKKYCKQEQEDFMNDMDKKLNNYHHKA
jgi:hypothetical protein